MKSYQRFGLAAVLIFWNAHPTHAEDLATRFAREFPAAYLHNKAFYEQLSGNATLKKYTLLDEEKQIPPTAGAKAKAKVKAKAIPDHNRTIDTNQSGGLLIDFKTINFTFDGDLMKMTFQKTANSVVSKDSYPPRKDAPTKSVVAIGKETSFRLTWGSAEAQPTIEELEKGRDEKSLTVMRMFATFYIDACYSLSYIPKEKFFPNSSFKIGNITPVTKDGLNLARIEFEVEWTPEETTRALGRNIISGWILARPDQNWVFYETLQSTKKGPLYHHKVIYEGIKDGMPLPKKISAYTPASRSILDLDQVRHQPVPEAEFTLGHYGLPNIDRLPGAPQKSSIGLWIFLAAIAILCVFLCVKWLQKRKTANI